MKKTLEIFISSSLDYVIEHNNIIDVEQTNNWKLKPIIDGLKKAKFKPVPWWNTIGVFHEGTTFLANLISASKKYDGGIFVLGDDSKNESTGKKGIPNLNVLLEAGMFYASKGIKRTLFIVDGNSTNIQIPSDTFGYEVPKLSDDNLPERIRNFFSSSSEPEGAKFDKTTFYISDEISKNIKERNYKNWKTKAQYIGNESVRIWDKIERSDSYKINVAQLTRFQKRIIDQKKVDFKNIDNIVSFGCGNGFTDNKFLKKLIRINDTICYIPIDINPMMAFYASKNIDPTTRMPFAIIDDFEEEVDHIKNIINGRINEIGENNFFMMLGVTFSNLEGIELDFFNKVNAWMDPNDYFLIDVSLNNDNDLVSMKDAVKDDHYKKLLYNSLIKSGRINAHKLIDDIDFVTENIENTTIKSSYTDVDNTEVYCYKYDDEILLISKRYNFDDIKKEIGDSFNLILSEPVESQSRREKAFFLFKL